MKEIDANRDAWSRLSADHYAAFKKRLEDGGYGLNEYILRDIGDISNKDIVHLQCNTGADTIALYRLGARRVLGVDLSPENVAYARRLASELGVHNAEFLESDVLTLLKRYSGKHDMAFTSEGVLGWLPDLGAWARTVRALLNPGGKLYVYDSHPTMLMFDEEKLAYGQYDIKYPYFGKEPDVSDSIGGYACPPKRGVQAYFWMHPVSEIINSLIGAGMRIDAFYEFPENFYDCGGMHPSKKAGLYEYDGNRGDYPMSFSLKATAE